MLIIIPFLSYFYIITHNFLLENNFFYNFSSYIFKKTNCPKFSDEGFILSRKFKGIRLFIAPPFVKSGGTNVSLCSYILFKGIHHSICCVCNSKPGFEKVFNGFLLLLSIGRNPSKLSQRITFILQ
jgi:hypothetical protein